MRARLIDHYTADLSDARNADQRIHVARYWRRAVEETLHERSLTAHRYPHRRDPTRYVCRYFPYWLTVADDELWEVAEVLAGMRI